MKTSELLLLIFFIGGLSGLIHMHLDALELRLEYIPNTSTTRTKLLEEIEACKAKNNAAECVVVITVEPR